MSRHELRIVTYICEEVRRQGHNLSIDIDGGERVRGMWAAWQFALRNAKRAPRLSDLTIIGRAVEKNKNANGVRTCYVRVGSRRCPPPEQVPSMLETFFRDLEGATVPVLNPLDYYRGLLEIHPFEDGNGRTGKVILNWLGGTLTAPVFPPNDFWGREIQNP